MLGSELMAEVVRLKRKGLTDEQVLDRVLEDENNATEDEVVAAIEAVNDESADAS